MSPGARSSTPYPLAKASFIEWWNDNTFRLSAHANRGDVSDALDVGIAALA